MSQINIRIKDSLAIFGLIYIAASLLNLSHPEVFAMAFAICSYLFWSEDKKTNKTDGTAQKHYNLQMPTYTTSEIIEGVYQVNIEEINMDQLDKEQKLSLCDTLLAYALQDQRFEEATKIQSKIDEINENS